MGKVAVTDNPRGEMWKRDETKFGFQMLEKMGWKKGQGLGRREDGIVEPIKVRLKDDVKGVGYHNKNDQWIENQETYDQLLANLNRNYSTETKTITAIESLEKKSRRSKCRVHYHKVVRGKDTQQYSEKDMTAVIGKRINEPVDANVETDNLSMENQFETSQFNINEYLAKKMAERRLKLENSENSVTTLKNADDVNGQPDCTGDVIKGEQKRKKHDRKTTETTFVESEEEDLCKQKKRKKLKTEELFDECGATNENGQITKKQSKKKKS